MVTLFYPTAPPPIFLQKCGGKFIYFNQTFGKSIYFKKIEGKFIYFLANFPHFVK